MSSSEATNTKLLVGQLAVHLVERPQHRVALGRAEQADPHQPADVRPRPRQVVGGQRAVERKAHRERHQLVGGTTLEPTVPERAHPRLPLASLPGSEPLPGPCLADQVCTPSPQSRTNPSESACSKLSSDS